MEDMRRFILEHGEFAAAQGAAIKHVNIVSQLSEVVAARRLMDVSTVRRPALCTALRCAAALCSVRWLLAGHGLPVTVARAWACPR